ncbi:MAG: TetR/AcrR family transcriptional regulator [Aristaeellaceae bacterium]
MQACRRIAAEEGLQAVNMRSVAGRCGVALGTLYNYYADKDELLIAAVESVWQDIFHPMGCRVQPLSFPDYVMELYACARRGAAAYPGFLTEHSMAIAHSRRGEGQSVMERQLAHMREGLLAALQADPAAAQADLAAPLTAQALADMTLDNILILLMKQAEDGSVLAEALRRILGGGCPRAQSIREEHTDAGNL